MNFNTFDLKEFKDSALNSAKEHPFQALIALAVMTGIGTGIANGIAKLGPHIENVGKYAVDKAAEHLPKPTAQSVLTDDSIIDVNADCSQDEAA